ncbi:MAG TPA: hypothetical protein VK694_00975 [Verrucomicrobiae bacterium]|nr:hypothetical protein [Verrucomicrobiae bacterium]
MRRVAVAPGLVLDDEMYAATAHVLEERAPEWAHRLTWEVFTTRKSWVLVPDAERPDEPFHKAELVVLNEEPWTHMLMLSVWHSPDSRKNGTPLPYSHPWPCDEYVAVGGFAEDRYHVGPGGGVIGPERHVYQAGDVNHLSLTDFREVTEILVPDCTLTVMDCGPRKKGPWGYLDPRTGVYTPVFKQPLSDRSSQFKQ